jgi:hypothetical protein
MEREREYGVDNVCGKKECGWRVDVTSRDEMQQQQQPLYAIIVYWALIFHRRHHHHHRLR